MSDAEFDVRMREIDAQLIERGVRVTERLILAWFYFTNESGLTVMSRDANLGPYEGPNLFWSITDWYVERYPTQATIGYEWGPRLIVIRGEVFLTEIPVHMNPASPLNAFEYIQGLSPVLVETLGTDERHFIQSTFNRLFWQASDLALNWTDWCAPPRHGLASDLIDKGWSDLRGACKAFRANDPDSVLFTIQQGPEKYLKALLIFQNPSLNEDELRKKYGHRIPKLLEACKMIFPAFTKFDGRIKRLDYGPDVRYHPQSMSALEVVEVIDLAHDICHEVARHLIVPRVQP